MVELEYHGNTRDIPSGHLLHNYGLNHHENIGK